ncbi:hypothetical protein AKJ09_00265 [Labilithrix luteola]|uniref:Tryptophan synthase alpha chain n=1 Tax=Labilithrix luteola TaxID=1391654 RepID=A0A0K1PJK7_9BACT|nr:hypothetical protein [Labilithrix luteola]AKU93601.1 hypothetical protein AKJ09_00265 [Labilithrix luteola]
MLRQFARRGVPIAIVTCALLASVFAGCADAVIVAEGPDRADASSDAPTTSTFTPPPSTEDGGDASMTPDVPKLPPMCIETECPEPWATCGASYKCGINLSNDNSNCGACGVACPASVAALHVGSYCASGSCQYDCSPPSIDGTAVYKNCDGLIENGCEVNIQGDTNNCGACGNKCAQGEHCIMGQCGCPTGMTDCNGKCIDLTSDTGNCGACGNVCSTTIAPDGGTLPPAPTNMQYVCANSQCGVLTCKSTYRDCDHDQSNGCEVNTGSDPNNCAVCGNVCAPGKICAAQGSPGTSGIPRCLCESGTLCGGPGTGTNYACVDLQTDINNCGSCLNKCPGQNIPNTRPTCDQGVCGLECVDGFGDCDGIPTNGCETKLTVDGSNCGACGNKCDLGAGQPCIEGKCAMTDCDAGETH